MQRFLLAALLLPVLLPCLAWAQTQKGDGPRTTPLFNYLTSNSNIHRSPLLRDLQTKVNQQISNVRPGLRADYIFDQFSNVRAVLGKRLFVHRASDTLQVFLIDNQGKQTHLYTFDLDTTSISELYEEATRQWKSKLEEELIVVFSHKNISQAIRKPSMAGQIAGLFKKYLEMLGIPDSRLSDINITPETLPATSAQIIAKKCVDAIFDWLEYSLQKQMGPQWKAPLTPRITDPPLLVLNDHFDEIHLAIGTLLNQTENTLTEAVETISTWLISGNTGVGISAGEGEFSGGLHLSANIAKEFQIGIYANSNFTADSAKPGRWLTGIQMRGLFNNYNYSSQLQIDVMLATRTGNHEAFRDFDSFEVGLGFQVNNGGAVIGLAFFHALEMRKGLSTYDRNTVMGLILQFSADTPSFLLGFAEKTGSPKAPLFQVSFPITAQL